MRKSNNEMHKKITNASNRLYFYLSKCEKWTIFYSFFNVKMTIRWALLKIKKIEIDPMHFINFILPATVKEVHFFCSSSNEIFWWILLHGFWAVSYLKHKRGIESINVFVIFKLKRISMIIKILRIWIVHNSLYKCMNAAVGHTIKNC